LELRLGALYCHHYAMPAGYQLKTVEEKERDALGPSSSGLINDSLSMEDLMGTLWLVVC